MENININLKSNAEIGVEKEKGGSTGKMSS
jgi:hypothetical protein